MTAVMQEDMKAHRRLHRRLRRELISVQRTERGTWTTSSNLPHEIRLHRQAGTDYVRVSSGMVVGVRPTKALLMDVNMLNTERAFARRLVGDGNILVVAEMPLASLRAGEPGGARQPCPVLRKTRRRVSSHPWRPARD